MVFLKQTALCFQDNQMACQGIDQMNKLLEMISKVVVTDIQSSQSVDMVGLAQENEVVFTEVTILQLQVQKGRRHFAEHGF